MTIPNIVEYVTDAQLLGLTISPGQEVLLRAIYALPMTAEQREIFTLCTGLAEPPSQEPGEVTVLSGVRSGKDSRIAGPIGSYEAVYGGHELALSPGERGVIAVCCQNTAATQVTYNFLREHFERSPILRTMLTDEPRAQVFELTNRMQVRCFPTTVGAFRTWSIAVGIMNEPQLYRMEGSVHSDVEIQASIRRGMPGFARPKLIKIATPYLRDGIVWDDVQAWGQPDPDRLVWKSTTALMNPTITADRLAVDQRRDPVRFHREFEAQFGDDVSAFVPFAWIDAAVQTGRFEVQPRGLRAIAAMDPSGGGPDAFTCAIVLLEGERVIQAVMRGKARQGATAPDLEALVAEYCGLARRYGCAEIVGDKYAGAWVKQAVERHRMKFKYAEFDRSQAYLNFEPLLAQGRIELLDHPAMVRELTLLERKPSPGGKDVVNHPRGGHDDHVNALALAAAYATLVQPEATVGVIYPGNGSTATDQAWRRPYFGLERRRRTLIDGLVDAPRPERPSQALLDIRRYPGRRPSGAGAAGACGSGVGQARRDARGRRSEAQGAAERRGVEGLTEGDATGRAREGGQEVWVDGGVRQ